MLDCVALVDDSGTYQYATPSYRETLGYGQGEMVGFNGFSLIHPDDRERIFKLYMEGFEKAGAKSAMKQGSATRMVLCTHRAQSAFLK